MKRRPCPRCGANIHRQRRKAWRGARHTHLIFYCPDCGLKGVIPCRICWPMMVKALGIEDAGKTPPPLIWPKGRSHALRPKEKRRDLWQGQKAALTK